MPLKVPDTVIISRPDRLGDAVITTPVAGALKRFAPGTRVIALVKAYTVPIWSRCGFVDDIVTLEELEALGDEGAAAKLKSLGAGALVHVFYNQEVARWAKAAGIPKRIAINRKLQNWLSSNVMVDISRKRSNHHEAQINIQHLKPFGVPVPSTYEDLFSLMGLTPPKVSPKIAALVPKDRKNVILHAMSDTGGTWGMHQFTALMKMLDPAKYRIFLTGTAPEAELYRVLLPTNLPNVVDLGGQLSLDELWQLISACDVLVAGSTGPLHLAAYCGLQTIGIYSNFRAVAPRRWGPIGPFAEGIVKDENCPTCVTGNCLCRLDLPAQRVFELIESGPESTRAWPDRGLANR